MFDPGRISVSFVVHTVTLGQFFFSPSTWNSPCQCHYTSAAYSTSTTTSSFSLFSSEGQSGQPKIPSLISMLSTISGHVGYKNYFHTCKVLIVHVQYMASKRKPATSRLQSWGVCINTAWRGLCVFTFCRSFVGISQRCGTYITHSF